MGTFGRRLRSLAKPDTRRTILRRARNSALTRWRIFASPHPSVITLGARKIGAGEPVFVIAEIGVNHNGSVERAKQLIDAAHAAGADAVKFQIRHLPATYQADILEHPELQEQSFQYLIPLLKEFELSRDAYRELFRYAESRGILALATAFDEPTVDFVSEFSPPLYKVASADLINFPLLERLLGEKTPLVLSTGMATLDEVDETAAFLHRRRAHFILLHCQSTYPAPADTLNLAMIEKLRSRYGVPVGYSGHELGIMNTIAAVALGASVIERHITLDRTLAGPDHSASLEPREFAELVKGIREYGVAYGVPVRRISRGEVGNRLTLRKSLVAASAIPAGAVIRRSHVTAKSPGNGISPQRLYDLVGRKAVRAIAADEMFTEADLGRTEKPPAVLPAFASRWGLKARFLELERLSRIRPRPKFFEFHCSYGDLDITLDPNVRYPQGLVVHAPEYFGKKVVDLAAADPNLWEDSIRVMQRTIDKTREIAKNFVGTPKVVIHVGGMSLEPNADHAALLLRAEEAFRRLDTAGVEVLPENLPPFGWFFSGLWHCNVFGDPDEMVAFCGRLGYRMCLDLSHAWLYTTHHGLDYFAYLKKTAPIASHLHIADGRGSHKEGLQIGEGDVPFKEAFQILAEYIPRDREVTWVPEIWQGQLHDYRQFRIALAKLAAYPFLMDNKKNGFAHEA